MSKVNSSYESTIADAVSVGNKADAADKAYIRAINSGDQGRIAKAQIANNKAQENLAALVKAADQKHDMIMQMIQSLAS